VSSAWEGRIGQGVIAWLESMSCQHEDVNRLWVAIRRETTEESPASKAIRRATPIQSKVNNVGSKTESLLQVSDYDERAV
jgi:hypothetical protein